MLLINILSHFFTLISQHNLIKNTKRPNKNEINVIMYPLMSSKKTLLGNPKLEKQIKRGAPSPVRLHELQIWAYVNKKTIEKCRMNKHAH